MCIIYTVYQREVLKIAKLASGQDIFHLQWELQTKAEISPRVEFEELSDMFKSPLMGDRLSRAQLSFSQRELISVAFLAFTLRDFTLLQLPVRASTAATSAHVSFLSPPIESIVELPSFSSLASSLPPFPSSSFPASYTSMPLPSRHLSSTAVSHDFSQSLSPLHHRDSPLHHRDSPIYHRDSPLSHRDSPLAHRDDLRQHESPRHHRDEERHHRDEDRHHRDEVMDRSIHRDHFNPPPEPAPSFSPMPMHHQHQFPTNPPSGPIFPPNFPPNTQSIAAAIMSAAGAGGNLGGIPSCGPPGSGPSLPHPIPVPINGRTGQGGQSYNNVEDEAMILLKKQDLEAMLSTRQVAASAVMDKQYVRTRCRPPAVVCFVV